jgi:hypothetical protein
MDCTKRAIKKVTKLQGLQAQRKKKETIIGSYLAKGLV